MLESVKYPDILHKGKQLEAQNFCMSLLEERFGNIDASIVEQVEVLSKEQLEALGRAKSGNFIDS
ncbi:DUF4351 domain-containing protein [Nostoc flagelliforme FACHB-838]|uniref:DUF4351 domain-containing protein n=2 Tax=Nostoc flagelliforme TaxID=1306274 RepID=A0ABR8DVD0_9NOSO|nr:DUF4351 domain-containing protein [Nostoc flagelliforme FACHB-838]